MRDLNHPERASMTTDIGTLTRFNVVGSSGSGKSTFASRLADALGLKHIEMDAIFWKPDWVQPPEEEFLADLRNAIRGDDWVLDGNYSRTVPVKWERVQAVIWLDLPYWQIIWQVVGRTLRRSLKRQELWSGNRESLAKAFLSRDSIILWSLTHLAPVRRGYEAAMSNPKYAHIRFIRLRSSKEAEGLLQQMNTGAG